MCPAASQNIIAPDDRNCQRDPPIYLLSHCSLTIHHHRNHIIIDFNRYTWTKGLWQHDWTIEQRKDDDARSRTHINTQFILRIFYLVTPLQIWHYLPEKSACSLLWVRVWLKNACYGFLACVCVYTNSFVYEWFSACFRGFEWFGYWCQENIPKLRETHFR